MKKQVSEATPGTAAALAPGDAPARNPQRWSDVHAPAARPTGRDPAAPTRAARYQRKRSQRRCHTGTG